MSKFLKKKMSTIISFYTIILVIFFLNRLFINKNLLLSHSGDKHQKFVCKKSVPLIGGIFLCFILLLYESIKQLINGPLLNQINISSLIILVGVAYEIQRTIRSLYKNILDTSI